MCMLLLLLLSRFSHVRLCAAPQTAVYQAPPSLVFSRQEHWSGLTFPSPTRESEGEVAQSCPTLRDPMDCSLPGSSNHGIFQARILEWVAIAFYDKCVQEWFILFHRCVIFCHYEYITIQVSILWLMYIYFFVSFIGDYYEQRCCEHSCAHHLMDTCTYLCVVHSVYMFNFT